MKLNDFKEAKQRVILRTLGKKLIELSDEGDVDEVELTLETLQKGFLDALQNEYGDWFGTEGWEHWLGLD